MTCRHDHSLIKACALPDARQGILASFDLKTVPALGTEFDYNLHEAIQQMPSEEYAEDIVCNVFQEGYMIGDKLVRPAIVAVSIGA